MLAAMLASVIRLENQPDVLHRGIDPAGDVAVGRFELAAARQLAVEVGGKLRAVGGQRMDLLAQRCPLAVAVDPALDGGVERVQRLGKTPRRLLDCGLLGHALVNWGVQRADLIHASITPSMRQMRDEKR
jgi:hypothetical protein